MKGSSIAVTRTEINTDPPETRFTNRVKDIFKNALKRNYVLKLELDKMESSTEQSKTQSNGILESKIFSPHSSNGCKYQFIS